MVSMRLTTRVPIRGRSNDCRLKLLSKQRRRSTGDRVNKCFYFNVIDDRLDFFKVGWFVFGQAQRRRQLVVGLGFGPDGEKQQQQVYAVRGREHVAFDGSAQFLKKKNFFLMKRSLFKRPTTARHLQSRVARARSEKKFLEPFNNSNGSNAVTLNKPNEKLVAEAV